MKLFIVGALLFIIGVLVFNGVLGVLKLLQLIMEFKLGEIFTNLLKREGASGKPKRKLRKSGLISKDALPIHSLR